MTTFDEQLQQTAFVVGLLAQREAEREIIAYKERALDIILKNTNADGYVEMVASSLIKELGL